MTIHEEIKLSAADLEVARRNIRRAHRLMDDTYSMMGGRLLEGSAQGVNLKDLERFVKMLVSAAAEAGEILETMRMLQKTESEELRERTLLDEMEKTK